MYLLKTQRQERPDNSVGERTAFSTKGAWITGHPHVKNEVGLLIHTIHKNELEMHHGPGYKS